MSTSRLDNFISRQKNSSSQVDLAREIEAWKKAVDSLYEKIETFLSAYIGNGDIDIEYKKTTIFEEHMGEYEIKAADIKIITNQIKLKPVGRVIIGAKGRVDMIGSSYDAVTLLLVEDTDIPEATDPVWVILMRSPEIKYVRLSQESFIDAMLSVIDEP